MIPARIEGHTRYLGPPPSWEDEGKQCSSLAIRDGVVDGIGPVMESMWEPTPEERLAIAAGANIGHGMAGRVHVPVYLFAGEPPDIYTVDRTPEETLALCYGVRELLKEAGADIAEPLLMLDAIKRLLQLPGAREVLEQDAP